MLDLVWVYRSDFVYNLSATTFLTYVIPLLCLFHGWPQNLKWLATLMGNGFKGVILFTISQPKHSWHMSFRCYVYFMADRKTWNDLLPWWVMGLFWNMFTSLVPQLPEDVEIVSTVDCYSRWIRFHRGSPRQICKWYTVIVLWRW